MACLGNLPTAVQLTVWMKNYAAGMLPSSLCSRNLCVAKFYQYCWNLGIILYTPLIEIFPKENQRRSVFWRTISFERQSEDRGGKGKKRTRGQSHRSQGLHKFRGKMRDTCDICVDKSSRSSMSDSGLSENLQCKKGQNGNVVRSAIQFFCISG